MCVYDIVKEENNLLFEWYGFLLFHNGGNLFKSKNSLGIFLILTKFFICIISIQLLKLI